MNRYSARYTAESLDLVEQKTYNIFIHIYLEVNITAEHQKMASGRMRRQQMNRRRKSLFKKAAKYYRDFEADVFLVVRTKPAGKVFLLDTSPDSNLPLSKSELVSALSNLYIPLSNVGRMAITQSL